jgi:hypothetical protein
MEEVLDHIDLLLSGGLPKHGGCGRRTASGRRDSRPTTPAGAREDSLGRPSRACEKTLQPGESRGV